MAGILQLFPKALLEAYLTHGDRAYGSEVMPIHFYQWTDTFPDGTIAPVQHAMWYYLCNDPIPGWPITDLTMVSAMKAANMNCLYVGGGSGRFGKYMESLGLECHHIDTSDDAITLMNLRGASCEKMDAENMTFEDNSYPLVVLAMDMFDCIPDPTSMLDGATRIASKRVIIGGLSLGDETVSLTGKLDWNGQTEEVTSWCYPVAQIVEWLQDRGMVIRQTVEYLDTIEFERIYSYWLVEAEWA